MLKRDALRAASLLAVLLAGSCAAPPDQPGILQDGAANHPISVEPSYRTLKFAYSGSLSESDSQNLAAFVEDFLARGNGAISVSAPPGAEAEAIIAALGEKLVAMGVPRSRILVGVQDATASDGRVEIGYIGYEARTVPCGDWSTNVGDTEENLPMPNFGCAVQQNIAAQVADPRDLAKSQNLGPADATRRVQVMDKYEQAQPTSSQKTQSQSGAVSDVGTQ